MRETTKKPLIILAGPTASGKTKTSIVLAKAINGEIISADSMQVYRHMDIGSAKIRPEEMEGVRHHLIDCLEPEDSFCVADFQKMAKDAAEDIYKRGRIPIIVGGTGFYIQSLLYDIHFSEEDGNSEIRSELEAYVRACGAEALHRKLQEADPHAAQAIHPNNVKRVIRALEYYEKTGRRMSDHNEEERRRVSPYRYAYFVLNDERSSLYERINRRVDEMLEAGLVEEVQYLKNRGCTREMVSMKGLGYKEILAYLDGECSLEEAVRILKRDTRHFAKRQITWFKREPDVIWVPVREFGYDAEKTAAYLQQCLKEKEII